MHVQMSEVFLDWSIVASRLPGSLPTCDRLMLEVPVSSCVGAPTMEVRFPSPLNKQVGMMAARSYACYWSKET